MTHEHDIPEDKLPGQGIFDTEFIRERLREGEEAGHLLWDEEAETYKLSARGILYGIGMGVMAHVQAISPEADQDEIMHRVVSCLPWDAKAQVVTELTDLDAIGEMPNPDAPDFELPDTLPEGWQ